MLYSYEQCLEKYKSYYQIKKALQAKKIFFLEKGVYSDKESESEFTIILMKYPNAVVTLNTAFYYYGLSKRAPEKYYLATERGTSAIRDPRVVQIFENSGKLHLGEVKAEHNDRSFRIYDKERMLVELLRHKNQFPFEYYKEILLNYRQMIHGLDIPRIYDYICALPKSKMVKNAFRLEVL